MNVIFSPLAFPCGHVSYYKDYAIFEKLDLIFLLWHNPELLQLPQEDSFLGIENILPSNWVSQHEKEERYQAKQT